jgi:hypothetical protein
MLARDILAHAAECDDNDNVVLVVGTVPSQVKRVESLNRISFEISHHTH